MSIKSALTTYLESKTAVTDLIGGAIAPRLYPVRRPENTDLPAIVYRRLPKGDANPSNLSRGAGHDAPIFRLECYAETYAEADALGEAVRQAMQGFIGNMNTTAVTACVLKDQYDGDWDEPIDGGDVGAYHDVSEYLIQYRTSIPTP